MAGPFSLDRALSDAATGLGITVTPEERAKVEQDQWESVLAHARGGIIAGYLFGMLLALHAISRLPDVEVIAWTVVKTIVVGLRLVAIRRYRRDSDVDPRRRSRELIAWLALDGALWGIASFRIMGIEDVRTVALVAASMAGVANVATFGLDHHVRAAIAYVAPTLLPTALGLALRGQAFGQIAAIGTVALTVMLIWNSVVAQRRYVSASLLREHALRLAAEREQALESERRHAEAKNRFVAKLSHELRTPLHGILGITELLGRGDPKPEVAERLGLIERSGNHLMRLIDDLLDISVMERGRFELHQAPFDLGAHLDELTDIVTPQIEAAEVRLETNRRLPDPCPVVGDAGRLTQVAHNLVGNAVKFARSWVRFEVAYGADRVRITVSDDGPGISEGDQRRIFEAFEQGKGARVPTLSGVGLGLAIVGEIAEAMGGALTLESIPGQGARFVFSAPLPWDKSAGIEDGHGSAEDVAGGDQRDLTARRVLLVEDDDVGAIVATQLLRGVGLDVTRVGDGETAVEHGLDPETRPDLVLMDCGLPGISGPEAARRLRAAEGAGGLERIPIYALTAAATNDERRDCIEAGMDGVLPKPFRGEQLERLVREALGG